MLPVITDMKVFQDFSRCFGETHAILFTQKDAMKQIEKEIERFIHSDDWAQKVLEQAFTKQLFLSYRHVNSEYLMQLMRAIHDTPVGSDAAIWYDDYLIPGRDYRVTGTLMVQSTGEELQIGGESVVASTDFTAEEGAGEADVRFVFDAQELEGDVVVFEEVYDMKTGVKITEHKDINYKGQTVTLIKKNVPHITSIPSIPGVPSVPEITETLTSTLPVPETGEGMSFVRNIGITILATGAIVFISLGLEGIKEKKKR